jgi:hypothetical protein
MSVHHVTLFDSWPHLSALMPLARPPGRCSRGSGIDCALPLKGAHRSEHQRTPPDRSRRSPCSPVRAASLPAHPRPHAHHRHRCVRPSDVAPTVRVSNQPSLSPSTSSMACSGTECADPSNMRSVTLTARSDVSVGLLRQHSAAPLGMCVILHNK